MRIVWMVACCGQARADKSSAALSVATYDDAGCKRGGSASSGGDSRSLIRHGAKCKAAQWHDQSMPSAV